MRIQATIAKTRYRYPYGMNIPGHTYWNGNHSIVLRYDGPAEEVVGITKRQMCWHFGEAVWYSVLTGSGQGLIEVGPVPSELELDASLLYYVVKGEVAKVLSKKELRWACMRIQRMNDCRNCLSRTSTAGCIYTTFPGIPIIPKWENVESLKEKLRGLCSHTGYVEFVPLGTLSEFGRTPDLYGLSRADWDEKIKLKKEAPSKIKNSIVARRICESLCYLKRVCTAYDIPYGAHNCQNKGSGYWGERYSGFGPITEETLKRSYANFFNELRYKRSVEDISIVASNGGLYTAILGYGLTLRKMDPDLNLVQFLTRRKEIVSFSFNDAMSLMTLPYRDSGAWYQTNFVRPQELLSSEELLTYMGLCQIDKFDIKTGGGWGSRDTQIDSISYTKAYDRKFQVRTTNHCRHSVDDILDVVRLPGHWHPARDKVLESEKSSMVRAAEVAEAMDSMRGKPLSQLRKRR